jgi:hypothetical protein
LSPKATGVPSGKLLFLQVTGAYELQQPGLLVIVLLRSEGKYCFVGDELVFFLGR